MEKKFLTFPFILNNKASDEDDDYYHFEGYASTYDNVDLGNDIVIKGAFDKTLSEKSPQQIKLLYQHDSRMPLGVFEEMRSDNNGLYVRGKMPKEHSQAKDVMVLMKCGAIDSMSIGYVPTEYSYTDDGDRLLKEIELYEISLVTMPMNPKAQITALKAVAAAKRLPLADQDRKWKASEAMERIKAFTDSEEKPSAGYKRAFLYHDEEDAKNFKSYKMPFADVINGELHAVPKALKSHAKNLGTYELEDEEHEKIKGIIRGYYKALEWDDPFDDDEEDEDEEKEDSVEDFDEDWDTDYDKSSPKKFYRKDIDKINTARDLERCLRDSGAFSRKAAIKLASKFASSSDSKASKFMLNSLTELKKIVNKN